MKKHLTILLLSLMAGTVSAQPEVYVARYQGDCQAALSLTFDDGLEEHYTMVYPQLKKRGLKGSFCIIGSKVGGNMKGTPCMTWAQLREMAADGHEITSHGWSHTAVTKISGEALRSEVQHNDTVIYNNVGVFPRTYFYPGNRKTDEALAFCSLDRTGTRTAQASIGSKRDSLWLRNWTARLLSRGEWGVGMTHGITHGYDAFPNPQILWDYLDYVCTLKESLWVATFRNVSAYIRERDDVSLDIRPSGKGINVVPNTSLYKKIFNVPLTMVVDTVDDITATQKGKRLKVTRKNGKSVFDFDPYGGKIIIK